MSAAMLSQRACSIATSSSSPRCYGCRPTQPVATVIRRCSVALPLSRGHRSSSGPTQQRATAAARRSRSVIALAATDSSNSSSSSSEPAKRHAFLHDFCMAIPYGCISVIGGLVSLMFGTGNLGLSVAVGGAIICRNAFKSLQAWKAGKACTVFTSTSAVVSAGIMLLAFQAVPSAASTLSKTAGWGLVALSAAMSLFLIYNISAGGNPPPSQGTEADSEASASAVAAAGGTAASA